MKTKRILPWLFVLFIGFGCSGPTAAQKNDKSEKMAIKELKSKALKEARKEAKKYKKEKYVPFPGGLPIEMQLEESWVKQVQLDDEGNYKYLHADGNAVAGTVSAAQLQALEMAKLELAGQIENNIVAIIETKVANDQIDRETAHSLTKVVEGGKNYLVQTLGYLRPVFKVQRDVGKKNVEVAVKVVYNFEEAEAVAKKAMEHKVREDLEEEADDLLEEIDRLFDPAMRSNIKG